MIINWRNESTVAHALAMEWLDVTLVGIDRGLGGTARARGDFRGSVGDVVAVVPHVGDDAESVLVDIADDPDDRWRRPWITACAILAGAEDPELGLEELAEGDRDGLRDGRVVRTLTSCRTRSRGSVDVGASSSPDAERFNASRRPTRCDAVAASRPASSRTRRRPRPRRGFRRADRRARCRRRGG